MCLKRCVNMLVSDNESGLREELSDREDLQDAKCRRAETCLDCVTLRAQDGLDHYCFVSRVGNRGSTKMGWQEKVSPKILRARLIETLMFPAEATH